VEAVGATEGLEGLKVEGINVGLRVGKAVGLVGYALG